MPLCTPQEGLALHLKGQLLCTALSIALTLLSCLPVQLLT